MNKKPASPMFKKSAVAALFIFFMTAVLAVNDYALADFSFFQTIKSLIGNVVSISGVSHSANEIPVNENQGIDEKTGEIILGSMEEARQSLAYEVAVPAYQ